MADVLDGPALEVALSRLTQWSGDPSVIERSVAAPSFLAGIDLVKSVAEEAERRNHHPDIDIRWRTVTFRLSTHDAGGVTEQDIGLAEAIDQAVAALGE